MSPPFTAEEFLDVFARYHEAFGPAPVLLSVAALAGVALAFLRHGWAHRTTAWILGGLWIWMGLAYHVLHFSEINRAAYAFGAVFILQGGLVAYAGGISDHLRLQPRWDIYGWVAGILVLYALAVYPLLGLVLGEGYPRMPTFGLPCPTTIFTFALFLWAAPRVPLHLLVIPVLWSILGVSAALSLGIVQDLALPLAGVAGTALVWIRNRRAADDLPGVMSSHRT